MSFWSCIREDIKVNRGNTKGRFIVILYRIAHAARTTAFGRFAGVIPVFLYKIIVNWLLCIDLDCHVCAGPGLRIFHGQGLVVNGEVIIGSHVTLRHNTTIGNKAENGMSPVIGDGAEIGANCVIIGPVTIGKNVVVGAGSVVVHDVPDGAIVVGNPAKQIRVSGC